MDNGLRFSIFSLRNVDFFLLSCQCHSLLIHQVQDQKQQLCIVGELAEGGSVAVAVGVSDM